MGMLLGTYLPRPVTTKHSDDDENDVVVFGVSSMQGWRETQEDAHNCILELDPGISVFAVYDGHGGSEVSEYAAQAYPQFLRENPYYLQGDYENGLKDSFVKFDCSLTQTRIIKFLRKLSKNNRRFTREEAEAEVENLRSLKAEALMPLEEVLAKYALSRRKSKKSKRSKANETSDNASPSSSKETVRSSEVNSVDAECSSSRSNTVGLSESDSEVTSSSSFCAAQKKGLSAKLCKNGNGLLPSTSNGSEASNSSGSSQNGSGGSTASNESSVSQEDAQPGSSRGSTSETSENSASCSNSVENSNENVTCNGQSVDVQGDEVISSSVENGEVEVSKKSGKGKSLVKHQPKRTDDGNRKVKDESSDSDSDDATFTDGDSKSDDDDDDDDEEEDLEEEEEEDDEEEDEEEEEEEDEDEEEEKNENEVQKEDNHKHQVEEESEEDIYKYRNKDFKDLKDTIYEVDEDSEDEDRNVLAPASDSGCTALVAIIKGDKLYVANAGDCRCVVSKNGEAIEMSFDHKPENEIELKRIEKAGGRVHGGRVNDGLNLSRAFGDHIYKRTPNLPPEEQMISPLPDIQTLDLDPDVEFMVLACDGIWNSMSSKQVVDFVRARLQNRTGNLSIICEQLFDHCLAPDTLCDGTGCDNMTAIIVLFKKSKFFASRKRPVEENEAEEAPKKQKTADVTSTDSIDSSQPSDGLLEKPSNSPDTTQ